MTDPFRYDLPKETLFVLSTPAADNKVETTYAAFFDLGKKIVKRDVKYDFDTYRNGVGNQSKFGKVYVATSSSIVTIDPVTAGIVGEYKSANKVISTFTMITEHIAYLGYKNSTLVEKIDLSDGKVLSSIDVGDKVVAPSITSYPSVTNSAPEPTDYIVDQVYVLSGKIFVTVSRNVSVRRVDTSTKDIYLNVLDLKTEKLLKRVELPGVYSRTFFPTYEKTRNTLTFIGSSQGQSFTGYGQRVNLNTLEVEKEGLGMTTFAGQVTVSNQLNTGIQLQHTKTPTPSTHLMSFAIDDKGEWVYAGTEPIYDLFTSRNAITLNDSETLAVLANDCKYFMCTTGAGIAIFDMKNKSVLTKIPETDVGFIADEALFVRK